MATTTTSTSTSTTSTSTSTSTTMDPWAYVTSPVVKYLAQVDNEQFSHILSASALTTFIEETLIPKAEDLIDSYVCRRRGTLRHFNPNATPASGIALDGSGKKILFLPPQYEPWISLGSVTIDGVAVPTIGDLKIHDQWIEYEKNSFADGAQNVVLFGTYGYSTVPHDIQFITGQICSNILLDMIRRNVAPDVFMSLMQSGSEIGDSAFRTLFAQPIIFTNDMKKQLDSYRIYWIDVG